MASTGITGHPNRTWLAMAVCCVAMAAATAACGLPRDMRGALSRIERERSLRVGLVENSPFVERAGGDDPAGVEADLVRRFAAELMATPQWNWQSEEALAALLAEGKLDLVVGGLTDDTPWADRVGITRSYYEDGAASRVMLVPPGENAYLMRLEGFLVREREEIRRAVENARGAGGR